MFRIPEYAVEMEGHIVWLSLVALGRCDEAMEFHVSTSVYLVVSSTSLDLWKVELYNVDYLLLFTPMGPREQQVFSSGLS